MTDLNKLLDTSTPTEEEVKEAEEKILDLKQVLMDKLSPLILELQDLKTTTSKLETRSVNLAMTPAFWESLQTLASIWEIRLDTNLSSVQENFGQKQNDILQSFANQAKISVLESLSSQFIMDSLMNVITSVVKNEMLARIENMINTGSFSDMSKIEELIKSTGLSLQRVDADDQPDTESDDDPEGN